MLLLGLCLQSLWAVDVTVTMNAISTTMSLTDKTSGTPVDVGEPDARVYTFSCNEGTYVLTAYATDGTTVNGTIELNVTDEENTFTVFTCTGYATNAGWTLGTDYSFEVSVASKMGDTRVVTKGVNLKDQCTFPVLNGDSYYAEFIPSEARVEEGYVCLFKNGTVTFNVTVSGAIPMGLDYTVSVPAEAGFFMGTKVAHFRAFKEVEPKNVETTGGNKVYTYRLGDAQEYNFRTWLAGGLTHAGKFIASLDEAKMPVFNLTASDYEGNSKQVNHSNEANGGYEVGDIFVNINEKGFKQMSVGDTYDVLGIRNWELVDNITNNYFIEPDFHYTVIDENGQPSNDVVRFDTNTTSADPWNTMTAVGEGTAIVLVTYDAIHLTNYSGATANPYLGGPLYGAIWPENTAAFVVKVGATAAGIEPNMLINPMNNSKGEVEKVAHPYVDAEFDVFYYLDTEEGATYTFTPTGVESVSIARPVIGENSAIYNGFSADGVTANGDGSYTLLLKQGRNIVRLTDAAGNSVYQVLTAKSCHRELINLNGSNRIQAGDQVKVQYSGLQHAANKLSGIHNFSCVTTYYEGTPDGVTLSGSANQYQFGSTPAAQAVTVTIPSDWDTSTTYDIKHGLLKVTGFGDPIGNHRLIGRKTGRNANFTALSPTAYFGVLPDVSIVVEARHDIKLVINSNAAGITLDLKDANGTTIKPNTDGTYNVTYANYTYKAGAPGYQAVHGEIVVADDVEGQLVVTIDLDEAPAGAWNGQTLTEPALVDGVYQIGTGAELAWFANEVTNKAHYAINGTLTADIELGDYDWTPIGKSTAATAFTGTFDGKDHTVSGLYINSTATHQGLFGYTKNATVQGIRVYGSVTTNANYTAGVVAYSNASTVKDCINNAIVQGKQYTAGVLSYASGAAITDRCGNNGDITGTGTFTSGVVGNASSADAEVTNCFNTGHISGTGNVTTIAHAGNASTVVKNCFNIGKLTAIATTTGNVTSAVQDRTNIENNYVLKHYTNGLAYETVVSAAQMESGEVAYLLGEAWGQEIDVDALPVIGGMKVYKVGELYLNSEEPDYELATLTFEDADYKAGPNYIGEFDWSSLIDSPQYGGLLLYGEDISGIYDEEDAYRWYDENNTYLQSILNNAWGSWAFWNGGVAVSNYQTSVDEGSFMTQLGIPDGKGNNESANFVIAFGYDDPLSGMGDCRPVFTFGDGKERVVNDIYVNNTAYFLNSVIYGDGFNTHGATETTFIDLVAEGFDADDESTGTVRIRLVDGKDDIIRDWTQFRLSRLGKIASLKFNYEYSDDLVGNYGFTVPAYVAVDDISVRISSGESAVHTMREKNTKANGVHTIFDLNGRRLNAPVKGALNIIDGKIVFVN